jgi:ABC-2 type transport system ATP-binding protein
MSGHGVPPRGAPGSVASAGVSVPHGGLVEVEGLTKRYGPVVAVDGLSFTVRPGRVTGFLGPNGSGKSTTLRCMLGLDRPDAGRCRFDGVAYREIPRPLTRVGAVLDATSLHPTRRARAHLRSLAASNRLPDRRVDEVLEQVGLTGVAMRRAGGFSLGMRQRLALAAALLGDPGVLLLDEPVNGLDPEGISWVRQFLRYLAGQGRTVLVSSHLLAEMAQTADDLVVIGEGRLIATGSVQEFITANVRTWVRVRAPRPDDLVRVLAGPGVDVARAGDGSLHVTGLAAATIGERAAANGLVLHELTPSQATLEEAFLAVTHGAQTYRAAPVTAGGPLPPPAGPPAAPPSGMPS